MENAKIQSQNSLFSKIRNSNNSIINNDPDDFNYVGKLKYNERLIYLEKYENFLSSYPKSQFCGYFLRGLCWRKKEECQFSHGINDLNYENFKKLSEDKKQKLVKDCEIATNIQKYAFLTNKNYQVLYQFLLENKDNFSQIKNMDFSLENINSSSKIRFEIRKYFHLKIFEDFCDFYFRKKFEESYPINSYERKEKREYLNHFTDLDQFDQMLKNICFKFNYKSHGKNKIFIKSFIDPKTKKKYNIIRLNPNLNDIFEKYMSIILENFNKLPAGEFKKILPLKFRYLNEIIIKKSNIEDLFIYHYMQLKNITYADFMNEIRSNEKFIKMLKKIIDEKNENEILNSPNKENEIDLINCENVFYEENLLDVINEFRNFFWDKYFNKKLQDDYIYKYGYMPYEFIRENFFKFNKNDISFQLNENCLNNTIKKILLYDKNFVFCNNNFKNFIINFNYFQSLKLIDYFNEDKYDKRCDKNNKDIQKILQNFQEFSENKNFDEEESDLFNSENSNIFNYLEKKVIDYIYFKKDEDQYNKFNQINFENFELEEIIVIDDILSFLFFLSKSKKFITIAIDLEGRLSIKNSKVNLVQIFDDSSKKIFIIDIYKIKYLSHQDQDILFESLQILITYILENSNISKIFHDGRRDIAALHDLFESCITNYVDTSCIYSFLKQMDVQIDFYKTHYQTKIDKKFDKKQTKDDFVEVFFKIDSPNNDENVKDFINNEKIKKISIYEINSSNNHEISDSAISHTHSLINNLSNPGLNKILESYEPSGNTNKLKDKIHKLMGNDINKNSLFTKRPIDNEFLLYSALDVKYLISSITVMKSELMKKIKLFHPEIKSIDIDLILRILSNDHMKSSCGFQEKDKK